MTKHCFATLALLASLCIGLSSRANSNKPLDFGFKSKITCSTSEFAFEITPIIRKVGDGYVDETYEQSGQLFRRSYALVTVSSKMHFSSEQFLVKDFTDPWEAAWPAFSGANFRLFSQEPGKPQTLIFRESELSEEADCRF